MKPVVAILATVLVAFIAIPAQAALLGSDAAACENNEGPAIRADVTGLKDRRGTVALELYPAKEEDFLKGDRDLLSQGKTFRRVRAALPASGPVSLCIRVPYPGRYALFFAHDRDGKNKFSFWSDGAGFPSNHRIGRSRPKIEDALITVGAGITETAIQVQYLRGLRGFAPLSN